VTPWTSRQPYPSGSAAASWPTPADYRAAIQNPQLSFRDPVLRTARYELDALQLPKSISGNFATVFHMASGGKTYAVRCFLTPMLDQAVRHSTISQYCSERSPASFAESTFLQEGILVKGRWYPITRMDWVSGESLDRYVAKNLNNAAALDRLATTWLALVDDLATSYIAHGDLQHGNVRVDNGSLRLVDYDGMFLPELASMPPNERGNVNYQHPERIAKGHYSAQMDTFSALVVYLSILAVRHDPSLWGKYHTGENLIFTQKPPTADFGNAGKTAIWRDLEASPSAEVRRLAGLLGGLCFQPVGAIPSLKAVLAGKTVDDEVPAFAVAPPTDPASASPLPGWMTSRTTVTPISVPSPASPAPMVSLPSSPPAPQPAQAASSSNSAVPDWVASRAGAAAPPPASINLPGNWSQPAPPPPPVRTTVTPASTSNSDGWLVALVFVTIFVVIIAVAIAMSAADSGAVLGPPFLSSVNLPMSVPFEAPGVW
jgi:hypothetical protein